MDESDLNSAMNLQIQNSFKNITRNEACERIGQKLSEGYAPWGSEHIDFRIVFKVERQCVEHEALYKLRSGLTSIFLDILWCNIVEDYCELKFAITCLHKMLFILSQFH